MAGWMAPVLAAHGSRAGDPRTVRFGLGLRRPRQPAVRGRAGAVGSLRGADVGAGPVGKVRPPHGTTPLDQPGTTPEGYARSEGSIDGPGMQAPAGLGQSPMLA